MSETSKIEWTDSTWNCVVGCSKCSPGCTNCYAEAVHNKRHKAYLEGKLQNIPQYAKPFSEIQLLENRLEEPLHWKKPRKIFVCSMSDLFHEDVPFEFIDRVMWTIWHCEHHAFGHTFMMLTKRPQRALEFFQSKVYLDKVPDWYKGTLPANLWLGVTVTNQQEADEKIPQLLRIPAAKRFVSVEPMLSAIDFTSLDFMREAAPLLRYDALKGEAHFYHESIYKHNSEGDSLQYGKLDWVICGGETGKNARPLHPDWVRSLRDQCVGSGTSFFFKSWGDWCPGEVQSDHSYKYASDQSDVAFPAYSNIERISFDSTDNHSGKVCAWKVGKKNAGHLIDGVEWRQFPERSKQ